MRAADLLKPFAASLAVLLGLTPLKAQAGEATIATAANFIAPMRALETDFEARSGHALTIVAGSTGKLYAQIKNGAPFDVFLAADTVRPALLAAEGLGDEGSIFPYALGGLVLWAPNRAPVADDAEPPAAVDIRRLAIANPKLAPYGAAAVEALAAWGLHETIEGKLVFAENIGQAFAMTASGAADYGLIAKSQAPQAEARGGWLMHVPEQVHAPIRQDGVLLVRAETNEAATAFMDYLQGPAAARIIRDHGYGR